MQLERTPQPGQIWQHFKGNEYRIFLVTGELNSLYDIFALPTTDVMHTELNNNAKISGELFPKPTTFLCFGYGEDAKIIRNPHVIYQQIDPKFPQLWARPLNNFLEIINTGVASSNYVRFTRIR